MAITKMKNPSSRDIIQIILTDHKPLWKFIKVLKSEKADLKQKKAAFQKFVPILFAHAKPEEQTWYISMKKEHDMSVEGLEGDVEHGLAEQLCNELKETSNHDMFMAKVKVLAELVEHHLEEEEKELLPEFRKASSIEERRMLGTKYITLQKAFKERGARKLKLVA
jgi:hemerythrin superfamily protein